MSTTLFWPWDFWIYDIFFSHFLLLPHLDPIEQERLLNSVITKLSEDSELCRSSALAHAYALRAGVRAAQRNWESSIEDAKQVVLRHDLKAAATDLSITLAYRAWADAEQQLDSGKDKVLTVLQQWQQAQPSYRSKVQREMQDLLGKWLMKNKSQGVVRNNTTEPLT